MRRYFTILILLMLSVTLFAQSNLQSKANAAYKSERYAEAACMFEELSKQSDDVAICYNLGNCYFRMDSLAKAILWYERALILDPSDKDVRFNLSFAQHKTIDKIVPEEDLFFVRWYITLLNSQSVNGWTIIGIVLFAVMLIALFLFVISTEIRVRKIGFYSAIVLLIAALASNLFAWQLRSRQIHRDRAVMMSESTVVKSTPNESGTDLFILHSGASMQIIDETLQNWLQIRLSNGKQGWISAKVIERI